MKYLLNFLSSNLILSKLIIVLCWRFYAHLLWDSWSQTTSKKITGLWVYVQNKNHNSENRREQTLAQVFYVEIQCRKNHGGGRGEFHYNLKFIRVTRIQYGMSLCENGLWRNWRSLRLGSGSSLLPLPSCWRRRSICTAAGSWRYLCNCMIFMCEFVVTAVIMGAGLLELHAWKLINIHNCSLWM